MQFNIGDRVKPAALPANARFTSWAHADIRGTVVQVGRERERKFYVVKWDEHQHLTAVAPWFIESE